MNTKHALVLMLAAGLALPLAAEPQSAPTGAAAATDPGNWEQLTPAQRELLVQPLRERWDAADAAQRQRMLAHARRWQEMPREERARARRGHERFDKLSPEQQQQLRVLYQRTRDMSREERQQALVLFHAMRGMSAEEREALRERWSRMNAADREAWVRANRPAHKDKRDGH